MFKASYLWQQFIQIVPRNQVQQIDELNFFKYVKVAQLQPRLFILDFVSPKL